VRIVVLNGLIVMNNFNESWHVSDDCVLDNTGKWIAVIHVDAGDPQLPDAMQIAERIAACVNACRGIPMDDLNSLYQSGVAKLLRNEYFL
jgi:hypothetical protein